MQVAMAMVEALRNRVLGLRMANGLGYFGSDRLQKVRLLY
jgi:hypothetical protein